MTDSATCRPLFSSLSLSVSRSLSLKLVLYIVSGRLVHSLHSFLSFLLLHWQSKAKQKQNIVCLASTLPLSAALSCAHFVCVLCLLCKRLCTTTKTTQEQQLLCCGARTPAATSASLSLLWGFVISAVKFGCTWNSQPAVLLLFSFSVFVTSFTSLAALRVCVCMCAEVLLVFKQRARSPSLSHSALCALFAVTAVWVMAQ